MTDPRPATPAVEIRAAASADVPEMARLLDALGYPITLAVLAERFARFIAAGEVALVAGPVGRDGPLQGVATLHATPVLHRKGAVGRITALVVDPAVRARASGDDWWRRPSRGPRRAAAS